MLRSNPVPREEDRDQTTNHTNHTNEENQETQSNSDSSGSIRVIRVIRGSNPGVSRSDGPDIAVSPAEDKDQTTNHTNEENQETQTNSDSSGSIRAIRVIRGSNPGALNSGTPTSGGSTTGARSIPVPPKYTSADFLKTDYWRLRGKLDVPKERWISYPHCSTDSDPTLVVGWAGWNHLEQATALVAYYDARKREGWDAKRLTPLLAGLDQLLPWIHQWHPEIDKEFGETAGQSFQTMLGHDTHELGLTLEDIRNWVPPATARKGRTTRKKKAE